MERVASAGTAACFEALTVAYVGTKGTHLEARPDINQPVPGTTPIANRRPYPLFPGNFDKRKYGQFYLQWFCR